MWIKVEDKLPEDMQQVWVAFKFDCPQDEGGDKIEQGYAIWSVDDGWYFDVDTDSTLICRQYCENAGLLSCTITHWQALPKHPEEIK